MEKVKVWTSAVLIPVLAILQMGCATIMGGGKQEIQLNSNPEGATVSSTRAGMEEKMDYTTPETVAFERKGHYILTFSKEGYETKKVELMRSMRGWMLVWDVLLGVVGIVIDAVTGAWYRLEPEEVNVTLTKLSSAVPGPDEIRITLSGTSDGISITSDSPVSVKVDKADR